jgi:calcium/calmodulin-dependent protein kinase (CaM kinase) II
MLDHPSILRIHEYFETSTNYFIVTELCRGQSLFQYVSENGQLDEIKSMKIFKQILVALSYCHHMGVTHRDLKPDNFIVTDDLRVKLIDFGLSSENAMMKEKVGSPMYIAPEILLQSEYTDKCDLWSAGCILFFMLSGGKAPFMGKTH